MKEVLSYRKKWVIGGTFLGLVIWFAVCLPNPLFTTPTSTILEDENGRLLAGRIASDGQWRFPKSDSLPDKFIQSIRYFEDEYFYQHPGFNPVSFGRAMKQNIKAKHVVSGGSTLTMQTIRLSRKGQSRSIFEKLIEVILAVRLEIRESKDEILKLYASNAPFGGNVVGLDAAAWRYYGRNPYQLSWGEMTVLAVLPNAPSLVYPGKNSNKLRQKRNRLLDKLREKGVIDAETCELAKEEPLPGKPHSMPNTAPHLLNRVMKEGHTGERVRTTIKQALQENVNRIVSDYHGVLSQNEIHNMAVLVLNVRTGKVMAYVGNSNCPDEGSGRAVDVITAPRSTGSILKPFLYTFMLQDGALLPNQLIPDIPTRIAGYAPKNFDQNYDGAVPAGEALARSLNIPAVRMLQDYGLEQFYHQLQKLHFSTISRPADHYGLSIILGGAEATLWDLGTSYMNMARTLNGQENLIQSTFVSNDSVQVRTDGENVFDPAALWWTVQAMSMLNRPSQEMGWQEFGSSQKVAWKTGTSFGHRDAWAIGFTPDHLVGVWVGNADGEGRPGLTGLNVAAPVMFKVFKHLPRDGWFDEPQIKMTGVNTCKQSGFLATANCPEQLIIHVPGNANRAESCPYHQNIHLDSTSQYRVSSSCYSVSAMVNKPWFVLPPIQEWYYKRKNPTYRPLPPFRKDCLVNAIQNIAVIYPKNGSGIFIPRNLNGSWEKVVFEIAHRQPETLVYWHLDNEFIGTTQFEHNLEVSAAAGQHTMTVVDEKGESVSWRFEALEK
ncbi:MAG: penicillin-binding protein 1C [Flavobacteriales bacterium]|nr:penicillin-binding protein 1C [Flavobacteriales bacterium]